MYARTSRVPPRSVPGSTTRRQRWTGQTSALQDLYFGPLRRTRSLRRPEGRPLPVPEPFSTSLSLLSSFDDHFHQDSPHMIDVPCPERSTDRDLALHVLHS